MASNNENFYKRLKSLAGVTDKVNETKGLNTRTLIGFERSNDGTAYGIVKENHSYFIKKSLVREGELKHTDFTYINGVENRGNFEFGSLGEAEKQRNFYIKNLNEAWSQGGVYFKNDTTTPASPKLEVKEDINSILRGRITEGKKNISVEREVKFKSSVTPVKVDTTTKRGLMPEAANIAVKKALGLLKEESVIVADSEIKDKDKVSEKTGKEESTAPITDKNAKAKADKATATGKKDANKKGDSSKSIAVNQANKALKENEEGDEVFADSVSKATNNLITADSQIVVSDSPANSKASKESAQAPINDENAKSEAEKASGKGKGSAAISNNTEEQDESNPFDDKENAGDESSDIVSEDVNKGKPFDKKKSSGKDIVAADSDQKDSDKVANKTGHKKPEAPYNNYNQPEKGHKDVKGTPLKPVASKKDIVAESDMITADSEISDSDMVANKTKTSLPKAHGKSEIVADSEIEASKALANMTKTKLPNPIAEGKSLATADSKIKPSTSPANDISEAGDDGEQELDAAAAALDDLDVATSAEETPAATSPDAGADMGGEEPMADLGADASAEEPAADAAPDFGAEGGEDAGAEPAPDAEGDAGAEPAPDAEGDAGAEPAADGEGDLMTKEIEKLVGKLTQKVRNTDLTPDQAKGHLKSLIDAFENDLGTVDVEDRKEMSDKILRAQSGEGEVSDSGEEEATDLTADAGEESVASGMEKDAESAIDSKIEDLKGSGADASADAEEPVKEEFGSEESDEMCEECGTFESYMSSRGYSKEDLAECSGSEMANLVSGFAKAHEEGKNDGDFENVAMFVTPEVANEVKEYGNGGYVDKLQPFLGKVKEGQGMNYGSFEPQLPMEEDDEDITDDASAEVDDLGGEEVGASMPVDVKSSLGSPSAIGFSNGSGEVLGAGVVKPAGSGTKSVDIDLVNGKVNVQVSEQKVREYVKNRLEELAGKKKAKIDESKKSETIKKLDRLIEQQWKLYGNEIKSQLKNGKK